MAPVAEQVLSTDPSGPTAFLIQPRRGWAGFNLRELWRYRELVFVLAWRNILVRYKQTVLGIAWAVLQPVFLMVVFTIFFGRLAGIPSDGKPYPVFAFAALTPWLFFSASVSQATTSVAGGSSLLTKVYFPRLAMPLSAVLSALVDLAISMVVLLALVAYYGLAPDLVGLLFLPGLVALALVTALGVGLWLSALYVAYRDVQYIVPFMLQLWLFASFVIFPPSIVPEPWRTVMGVNPMAGVIEGFRWALLGTEPPPLLSIGLSVAVALALLVSGAAYFRKMERTFADVV